MAARKTAAQKAAEAAEVAEYTGTYEAPTEAPAEKPAKVETVQQLKNRLRNEAEREVLNAHKDEVITITQAKYDEHGLEYVRRLTDKEKAAKDILDQLEKYPDLEAVIAERIAQAQAQVRLEAYSAERNAEQAGTGYPAGAYQGRDAGRVEAEPGGALDTFRKVADDYVYGEEPDNYRDVEAREGE